MNKNQISKEDIKKLSDLADLDVSGQEGKLSEILSETLDYVKTLEELDTENVEETFQVTGLTNVFRDEGSGDLLTKGQALSNARETDSGLFSTKAVFNR
jgi:aspartyl-tRNA(Asn)/glutamyl-tRNA(Gln) amidotransferase subunit C